MLSQDSLLKSCWFFDYDGSLCPHLEVWEEHNYDSGLILQTLLKLQKKSRGVYWNTGRRLESLLRVNADYGLIPGYFVHGSYSWDTKNLEQLGEPLPPEWEEKLRTALKDFPGLRLEIKPTALRVASTKIPPGQDLRSFRHKMESIAPPGWKWHIGHRGMELLQDTCTKATGLQRTLALMPKDTLPLAVGDDPLDGPALREALVRGGIAVLIGENCGFMSEIPHKSSQILYFEDPSKFHEYLEELCS